MNYDKDSFLAGLAVGRLLWRPKEPSKAQPYLKFSSSGEFSLSVASKNWSGVLEYSTDGNTWTEWDGTSISSNNGVLMLRGTGNTVISGGQNYKFIFSSQNSIRCTGNIENLLDYQTVANNEHPEMGQRCFQQLFRGCTVLETPPELPATTLAHYCYQGMFYGCTALTTPPELPATVMYMNCYSAMFSGCTSLTKAPKLPATFLYQNCYNAMFNGCTALTEAPDLPAHMPGSQCYMGMFAGCTSLTKAPVISATEVGSYCCGAMFQNCTSLKTPPALPATRIAAYCYANMFQGCTALETVPALPATDTNEGCYNAMFDGCTSLSKMPALPAQTIWRSAYYAMFRNTAISIRLTADATHQVPFMIPKSGGGSADTSSVSVMFINADVPWPNGTPDLNTTYYTNYPLIE